MFVLSGLHRPWQPSRHLPPQLCLDLNTGNDAWTPNPGWSDIVEWKHHWKKILVRTIWPKISWAIQIINPTFTWLHGLCQKMFQCEPFCLVEHSISLIYLVFNMLYLEGPISPSCNLSRGPDWWQRRWAMFFPGCAQQFGAFSASLLFCFLASAIIVALLWEGPL